MANSPRFTKTIVAVPVVKIGDTVLTTIYAANATYDSRITGINVSSDESTQNIALFISDGTTDFPAGLIATGAAPGTTIVPSVGLIAGFPTVFRERDANGVTILNLPKGNSLKVKLAAITGGKFVYILVKAELYD